MSELELIEYLAPRILTATFCGVLIGLEREFKQKVAGIRTHMIVCTGAAIFASVSFMLGDAYYFDQTRIIAATVTGVGFLGAGVIFKTNDKVYGITSAAFIWLTASIGVLAGMGFTVAPIVFTLGLLIVLLTLRNKKIRPINKLWISSKKKDIKRI
jgi:putative Mg2+ transporter-C (MgtC) family protein